MNKLMGKVKVGSGLEVSVRNEYFLSGRVQAVIENKSEEQAMFIKLLILLSSIFIKTSLA